VLGLAGVLMVSYVVLKLAPDWFAASRGLNAASLAEARQGVRTSSIDLLAGTLALIGAIYTARTFALNRGGQITERFSRAIEQIGNAEMDVRLGGIYGLERIARESQVDHGPIMEVLTAYVRRRSPLLESASSAASPTQDHPTAAIDIEAVMTVFARRDRDHEDRPFHFRLMKTNLAGIEVPGIDLRSSELAETQLQGAEMAGAQLQGAYLAGTRLTGTTLTSARLDGATLTSACLDDATLTSAHLNEADLSCAHLRTVDAADVQLQGAYLAGAELQGAYLAGAHLQRADFSGALMEGANLHGAQLDDANLRGTQLQNANLTLARLTGAVYDASTVWPAGFDATGAGAVLSET
jgi:uncharacterized protein YjbI with pentapeptide repeats